MIEIGTAVFFILAISVLFVYRWNRAGYSSILFFNKELDTDSRYDSAEKIRVAQVALGFLYFIVHSLTLLGLKNTLIFFFSSFVISLFLEIVGTNRGLVFGKYSYNHKLCPGPMVGNVPILIAISWTGLIYMALICSMMILDGSIVSKINYEHIFLCSALVTALDLVLDPIAVDEGRWHWHKPGKYYGVPLKNFIGWFFNSAVILITYSILSYPFSNENNFPGYIEFSPGILFVVLPAIASRPCFERDLNKAGAVGIIITLILIFLCGYNFL